MSARIYSTESGAKVRRCVHCPPAVRQIVARCSGHVHAALRGATLWKSIGGESSRRRTPGFNDVGDEFSVKRGGNSCRVDVHNTVVFILSEGLGKSHFLP